MALGCVVCYLFWCYAWCSFWWCFSVGCWVCCFGLLLVLVCMMFGLFMFEFACLNFEGFVIGHLCRLLNFSVWCFVDLFGYVDTVVLGLVGLQLPVDSLGLTLFSTYYWTISFELMLFNFVFTIWPVSLEVCFCVLPWCFFMLFDFNACCIIVFVLGACSCYFG